MTGRSDKWRVFFVCFGQVNELFRKGGLAWGFLNFYSVEIGCLRRIFVDSVDLPEAHETTLYMMTNNNLEQYKILIFYSKVYLELWVICIEKDVFQRAIIYMLLL